MNEFEEQERLARIAERRAANVARYEREWGDLTDQEVIAELIPTGVDVIVPLVMTQRQIAAMSRLEERLKWGLTWVLATFTAVLLVVTIGLLFSE